MLDNKLTIDCHDIVDHSTCKKNNKVTPVITLTDHAKLENLDYDKSGHTGFAGVKFGTVEEWAEQTDYVPSIGTFIVYSNFAAAEGILIPALKIGDGVNKVGDLPFLGNTGVVTNPDIAEFIIPNFKSEYRVGERIKFDTIQHREINIDQIVNNRLDFKVNGFKFGDSVMASELGRTEYVNYDHIAEDNEDEITYSLECYSFTGKKYTKSYTATITHKPFLYIGSTDFSGYVDGEFKPEEVLSRLRVEDFEYRKNYRLDTVDGDYCWFCASQPLYIQDTVGFDYTAEYYLTTVVLEDKQMYFYRSPQLSSGSFIYKFVKS